MNDATLIGIVMAGGTALGGAVTFLFKMLTTQNEKHAELNRKVGVLEGRQEGVSQLAEQTLEVVAKASTCRYDESVHGRADDDSDSVSSQ